jgi:eukaryotic-like serine/threonine-protein kinase
VKLKLTIIAGPHKGQEFVFDGHDTLLVGRARDAHLQISADDPFFSRRHFLVEVNPPRCRVIDLNTRNGTRLNGTPIQTAEVAAGDEIAAGHTVFKVSILGAETRTPNAKTPPVIDPAGDLRECVIPGYRIHSELGRGGMGVVYRAIRERDRLPVAVKTILPVAGTQRKQIDRFLRECQILAQLEHPNIFTFRESGATDRLIFLVMDLVDGTDLSTRVKKKGAEEIQTAVRIACQILSGLAHAHGRGYVHRDIKPSNILISHVGNKRIVKLADFGLARISESSQISGVTMQGEIGGTPAYMAPEQVTHFRQVKPAADQYSVAATLYNLLTNAYTHNFPSNPGLQIAHLVSTAAVPITERQPAIPPKLARVIHKALSREPEERYPDVLAFREELKPFA